MFCAMMVSACDARVATGSSTSEVFIAARTSGGRSVEVLTMSCRTLSKNEGSIIWAVYWTQKRAEGRGHRAQGTGQRAESQGLNAEGKQMAESFRTERDP